MSMVDEIEELRAELRHCRLTARDRQQAEARIAELIRMRDQHNATPIRDDCY